VSADRHADFAFDPAELAEDVELPLELKKEILYLHARLAGFDHWQVLGVAWNAPVPAVRAAYVEKVKVFHPDRHAGRKLGSYLPRIEKIFRALTAARDVLCDETKRDEYARKTAPPEQFARMEARRLEDEVRAQERRARLARGNPMMARVTRVQELLQRGKTAMAEGKFAQAANDFLTVVGLDPRNLEARGLADQAKRRSGAERARSMYERAVVAEAAGNQGAALAILREIVELVPEDPRYATAGSRLALLTGSVELARQLAERAVRAAPRDARALEALGAALHASGEKQEARRVLEQALAIDPELPTARKLATRLRWSFR